MKTFEIYQVNRNHEDARSISFESLDYIKSHGIVLTLDMYEKKYEGEVKEGENTMETLEDLFLIFNSRRPADFTGHSMSTSDVVKMDGKFYYCDSFGWEQITL